MEDALRAQAANREWWANKDTLNAPVPSVSSSQWEPPPSGWLKCNFDCSYHQETRSVGLGFIVRDDKGKFLVAGMSKMNNVSSPLQGEALGFLYAAQQIWVRGWRHVWFEGDSVELERIINQVVDQHVLLGNVIHDIRFWISRLPICSLGSVNRKKNSAADALSKKAIVMENDYIMLSIPPPWLIRFLYEPFTI